MECLENDLQDKEKFFCSGCHETFSVSDFDYVDDEFDPDDPLCPDCKMESRIAGAECIDCDRPAAYEVERGLLCEDCFEHYADGYSGGY